MINIINSIYKNVEFTKPKEHTNSKQNVVKNNLQNVYDDMKKLKQITRTNFIRQSSLGKSTIDRSLNDLVQQKKVRVSKCRRGVKGLSDLLFWIGE